MKTATEPSIAPSSEARRALLAERLRKAAVHSPPSPLSFAQQRIWFLDQLEPGSPLYNIPTLVRLIGKLDVGALEQSLAELVARHESLRTHFVCVEGNPMQVIAEQPTFEFRQTELPGAGEDAWRRHVQEEVARPFDLGTGPMLRALLLRLNAEEHLLALTVHHIVADEWSLRVMFRELAQFYEGFVRGVSVLLPELPIQYADFAVWQRDWLQSEVLERQLGYWREQLGGNPPVTGWLTDHPRGPVPTFHGRIESRALGSELSEALKILAQREGATLFMVLLAALKALLYRCTQQEDLIVGSPIAGRDRVETEGLIGFFVNTLPLRTTVSGELTFRELLARVRAAALGAFAHQDMPFDRTVQALQPERSLSHNPFTGVMFLVQNDMLEEMQWPGLRLQFLDVDTQTAKFDTTFVVQETSRGLVVRIEYNTDLFEAGTITRLLGHFATLLEGVAAGPQRRIGDLPLLTEAERHQLVEEWNATATDYPRGKCLHELFEQQVERAPEAVAVAFGKQSLTYRALNLRADQLARVLRQFQVGPDVPVAICFERSVNMVVGLMAILKAGGAYVPLDPAYPQERLALMLNDTQAPVLLTQRALLPRLPRTAAKVICLDGDGESPHSAAPGVPGRNEESLRPTAENLAYIMYTSGSTGQPKGVAVPHRAVSRLVLNTNYVQLDRTDRIAHVSNISFDAATFEIWGALLNGARLIGINQEVLLSPKDFARELREQGITAMFLTSALFNQVAGEVPGAFATLRTLIVGGEALDPKWVRRVLGHQPPQRLVNGYGPTENTTFTCCHLIQSVPEEATQVPIGRPIANTQVYILDPQRSPVPIGVPGELYAGGDGLARGYWNRPELAAEKFVTNPFCDAAVRAPEPGQRPSAPASLPAASEGDQPAGKDAGAPSACPVLYRTGDLARYRADGSIEFLGRRDHQVKLRGFRIELGEIETVLARHPQVHECIVALRNQTGGGKRLVAYYVQNGGGAPNASELREFLTTRLPDYMVPAAFVPLAALPLTPNGKVDRLALPEPEAERPELGKKYAPPRDDVERQLTRIWESVLDVRPVGIADKFFDLGGHSLLAVRLSAQIEKAFGRKLRLATILQAPTVAQLAAILREETKESQVTAASSVVEIQGQGSRTPFFLVHGAGGGMFWGYANLSRHLDADQPVYGFKSRGLDGQEEFATLEEMAAKYVADLRVVQPRGPYCLGGYCFGGNVAYEMARQLEVQGERVALLALLNCAPPNSRYTRINWTPRWWARFVRNLVYWATYFWGWSPTQRREFFRWKWTMLNKKLGSIRWRNRDSVGGASPGALSRAEAGDLVDLSSFTPEQRVLWEAHIRALLKYHPQPCDVQVQLFRSPGHPLWCSFDPDYGWGDLARGGVQIIVVPGAHEKILEEPSVEALAAELRKLLRARDCAGVQASAHSSAGGLDSPAQIAAAQAAPPTVLPSSTPRQDPPGLVGAQAVPPQTQETFAGHMAYWKTQLAGAPALLELPTDHSRPPVQSGRAGTETHTLSPGLVRACESLARREGTDVPDVLLGALEVLLQHYTRQDDIFVGMKAGAGEAGLLVLRTDASGDPTFQDFLRRVRQVQAAALEHHVNFRKLVEELCPPGDTSYHPLVQVLFDWRAGSTPAGDEKKSGNQAVAGPAGFDLLFHVLRGGQDLVLRIEYSADLFESGTIQRMLGHWVTLLESITTEPNPRLSRLRMLTVAEEQLLEQWNDTARDFPRDKTLFQLFEEQAERTPGAEALVCGRQRLTYRELRARAAQVADRLRTSGVRNGTLVGICLERSWEMIAGILGTLEAGGAYVPMDPAYPQERLAFILHDAKVRVLLTQRKLRDLLPGTETEVLCVEDFLATETALPERVERRVQESASASDLAYVIYTSGSTGKPKGVAIEHRSAVALVSWAKGVYSPEELSGALFSTSICFDVSVFELFVPLCWGGKIILAEHALALPELPAANEVRMIGMVPSAIRELLRVKGIPASVRVANLAGEPLAAALVDQIYGETSIEKVHDLYGPTEATVYSTFALRKAGEPATIGRPLANEQIYLLDRYQQAVPIGVPGELYIGGAGVARGYLDRPELTAERFVPHPALPDARLYRTGDLARWRADGNIEFLGRIDHQVKIRGFRIELGEIEAVLKKQPQVAEAVVVAKEIQPGDHRLVAYVVRLGAPASLPASAEDRKPADRNAGAPGDPAGELRQALRQHLPEYMIPSAFVFLAALPLTPNGKVDRKALPMPELERSEAGAGFVEARTDLERQVAAIWREVLGLSRIGIHDNFFELGGHSLLAIQITSRLRQTFQQELPLFVLFELPTIAELAEGLAAGRWASRRPAVAPLVPVPRSGHLPASFVQERLWVLDQFDPGSDAYNVPFALRLTGRLNITALQRALNEVVRRHEALRTTFQHVDGDLVQVVAPHLTVDVPVTDISGQGGERQPGMNRAELMTASTALLSAVAQRPFDLSQGPLIRASLTRLAEDDHVLLVVMHHSISDGWSLGILHKELAAWYRAFAEGVTLGRGESVSTSRSSPPALPELPVQYADFAVWQRQWMQGPVLEQELHYWKEKLAGAPATVELPVDVVEPAESARRAAVRTIQLSADTVSAMVKSGQREGGTVFMTLMTALAITLRRWTGQNDLVLGTVVAGRNRREIENLIGCFMNFLPIRTKFEGIETGRQALARVRAAVLEGQSHQDCPFERIVEAINPERRQDRNPLYNMALVVQDFPAGLFSGEALRAEPVPVPLQAALLDLRFVAESGTNGLSLSCEYRTDLFAEATIRELMVSLHQVLEKLVREPEAGLAGFEVTAGLAAQAKAARARKEKQTIAVAGTFTIEPIEEPLRYWMKELDLPVEVAFAPYNQIFQQLLDPSSLLASNQRGLNLVCLRLTDWRRAGEEADEAAFPGAEANIERSVGEFTAAMRAAAARSSAPWLVCLCPPPKTVAADPERAAFLARMEQRLGAELESVSGVQVITSAQVARLYPVADYDDPSGDELGQVPYTPLFFTALGTVAARRFHALNRPACKVIALDCDNTLWAGICGEDGALGVRLEAPYRALQKFMLEQQAAGRLLCLCSKNNEEDALAVFGQRNEMPLRLEHFAARRLNWQPKSENLKSLARELGLGLDSFIFIDDNPVECAEVEANCPEVLALQLPENPEQIPQFLEHCWVFDHFKLTAEDRRRAEMYRQNQQREQLREQSPSLSDFLAGLDLRIEIAPMTAEQLPRVAQLTQRTNQFNFTTRRRTESELQTLPNALQVLTVRVSDRFGDYGLVGVIIWTEEPGAIAVDTFLLSCRVLGRGVEHRMLARLGEIARERRIDWLEVPYEKSARNKPALDFLENAHSRLALCGDRKSGGAPLTPGLSPSDGESVPARAGEGEPGESMGGSKQALSSRHLFRFPAGFAARGAFHPPSNQASAAVAPEVSRPSAAPAPARKFTRCRAIALEANDAAAIHRAIEAKTVTQASARSDYAPPRTALEQQLCECWQKLLRLERVGIRDNFFELGGHSLLAVRLFAQIEKHTGRKLPLVTLFQAPTIEELAKVLGQEDRKGLDRSLLVPIQPNGSRAPLFLVHGAGGDVLWGYANLAAHLHPDQPVYGIKSRGQAGLEEFTNLEEMASCYVDEVRKLQAHGPYYLGGYCFGGNVAYEMARQLRARGEKVALVALLDSAPNNAGYEKMAWWQPGYLWRFAMNFGVWLGDFAHLQAEARRHFLVRKSRALGRKLRRLGRRGESPVVDLEDVIETSQFPAQELKLWQVHLQALVEHTDQPYPGEAILLRTRGQPLFCSLAEDFCWGKLAEGGVVVKRIPGSHENVFMEPNVKSLAGELSSCLARAAESAEGSMSPEALAPQAQPDTAATGSLLAAWRASNNPAGNNAGAPDVGMRSS